jgi:ketosteroid isomerase-like protein
VTLACATTHGSRSADPHFAIADLLHRQYAAVERGDLAGWAAELAPDAVLLGSDPGEAFVGRDAILAAMTRNAAARMRPEVKRSYRSTHLVIGVAPGGRSAWAADEIEYVVAAPEGTRTTRFRMTALAALDRGRFHLFAVHYSVAIPHREALARADRLPAPADLGDAVATVAEPVVELFRRGLAQPPGTNLSERDDVVVIGSAPDEIWVGGRAIRARMAAQPVTPGLHLEPAGGIRAALTPDLESGWVLANVRLQIPGGGGSVTLPFRTLEIFVREGDAWRVACLHSSVGVPD